MIISFHIRKCLGGCQGVLDVFVPFWPANRVSMGLLSCLQSSWNIGPWGRYLICGLSVRHLRTHSYLLSPPALVLRSTSRQILANFMHRWGLNGGTSHQFGTIEIYTLTLFPLLLLVLTSLLYTPILKLHSLTFPRDLFNILLHLLNFHPILLQMIPIHINLIPKHIQSFFFQCLSIDMLIFHLWEYNFGLDIFEDCHVSDEILLFELGVCLFL